MYTKHKNSDKYMFKKRVEPMNYKFTISNNVKVWLKLVWLKKPWSIALKWLYKVNKTLPKRYKILLDYTILVTLFICILHIHISKLLKKFTNKLFKIKIYDDNWLTFKFFVVIKKRL